MSRVNNSMEDLPLAQALPIGGTSADDQGQDLAQLHSWLQRLPAEVQASTKDAAFVQAGAHAMVLLTSGLHDEVEAHGHYAPDEWAPHTYILTNSGAKPAGTVKVSVGGGGKFWPDSGLLNTAEATSPAEHTVMCDEGDTGTYVCSALATTTGGQRLKGKCFKRVTYNRKSRKLPKDVTRSDLEDDESRVQLIHLAKEVAVLRPIARRGESPAPTTPLAPLLGLAPAAEPAAPMPLANDPMTDDQMLAEWSGGAPADGENMAEMRQGIAEAKTRLDAQQTQIEQLSARNQGLEAENQRLSAKMQALEAENHRLRNEILELVGE